MNPTRGGPLLAFGPRSTDSIEAMVMPSRSCLAETQMPKPERAKRLHGNMWRWDPSGYGGDHWDVQHETRDYTRVDPEGRVIGKDKFPSVNPRPIPPPEPTNAPDSSTSNLSQASSIAGTAAGGLLWWIGKAASPLCGPATPNCAVGF